MAVLATKTATRDTKCNRSFSSILIMNMRVQITGAALVFIAFLRSNPRKQGYYS
jgi:hypothetical protein